MIVALLIFGLDLARLWRETNSHVATARGVKQFSEKEVRRCAEVVCHRERHRRLSGPRLQPRYIADRGGQSRGGIVDDREGAGRPVAPAPTRSSTAATVPLPRMPSITRSATTARRCGCDRRTALRNATSRSPSAANRPCNGSREGMEARNRTAGRSPSPNRSHRNSRVAISSRRAIRTSMLFCDPCSSRSRKSCCGCTSPSRERLHVGW